MRRISKAALIALAVAMAGGVVTTPALAEVDFRFGIDIGPRYHYGPRYHDPYYGPHYYHPHGRYYYYR